MIIYDKNYDTFLTAEGMEVFSEEYCFLIKTYFKECF